MQLIWLRSDLRVHDNTALVAACERGPALALWLASPGQWKDHDDAPCKVDFWLRNLRELKDALAHYNIPLLVRHAEHWSSAPQVIHEVCREHDVQDVHVNEEYGINEARRDRAVGELLQRHDITLHSHLDQLLFKPGTVLTKSGGYFKVFTQFRKVCYQRLHHALPPLQRLPRKQAKSTIDSDEIPASIKGFAQTPDTLREQWPAGEDHARKRLKNFVDDLMADYPVTRDLPAVDGTSQLSPYLAAGVISVRQCLHAALASNHGEFESGNPGAVSWINELLWREFYKHVLAGYPRVSRHRAFRPATEAVQWRDAPSDLEAWQQGRTGVPIVDAAMRQLLATGWMHNRLRMVVAMFLSKNLLIDWREGERFFMRHLIDGDLAANNGGWQWSASTGTDSVPYFRVFNPVSQSQRFDSKGRFLKHWLPELQDLDERDVHSPGGLFAVKGYPQPIVDLGRSRQRAIEAFRQLPKDSEEVEPDRDY
ncbi:deoxyribodipyrimidine photo-lyase [Pseudomonas sp. 148P]|uniref:Deoxyribodipyrimidine photo-lyase n=1 Tax=Pseudomonas ulcerans TaxID=3115852 RepID=A0ABU7HN17_9PSED|nr:MULTISPECIES: deoxyribodipyrimidine photo-lyase [unclassified Pseudomonas]MEE1922456.1 deoxyribodipyrimidine photo-lyase [Pseudomonas sp. 147P]MEE1932930.1 deoxyribodipyrimidine photo-lyase [Pseudomonas sp. 148P]